MQRAIKWWVKWYFLVYQMSFHRRNIQILLYTITVGVLYIHGWCVIHVWSPTFFQNRENLIFVVHTPFIYIYCALLVNWWSYNKNKLEIIQNKSETWRNMQSKWTFEKNENETWIYSVFFFLNNSMFHFHFKVFFCHFYFEKYYYFEH